ncbi:MAG: hypothetical protein IH595_06250 [Bacteroidales bacterium]|nr:hypothetical protein [Bacteroidales bacterium]
MRNSILILGSALIMTTVALSSCQSSGSRVQNAKENVQEAKQDLSDSKTELYQAQKDSINAYQQFKQESEAKIAVEEKNLADFKAKIASEKKAAKAINENKIAVLEQKIADLKMKLENYSGEGGENWISFKNEFNHDMAELMKALKDLTVDNVK